MFRIFIPVLFTIFSCSMFAQDTLNVTDSYGRKQGLWRKRDSVGRIVYEGRFKDGIPAGEFRYFYPDGKLKTVSVLSNQGKRAVTTSYFLNGRKMAAGNYLNEKKDSTWQFFSESTGTLVSEEEYVNGMITGFSKVYYPAGGLSEEFEYKNGIRDGRWEQYWLDGKIKLIAAYRAGEKQGLFKTFYNSGQLMITGQYIAGRQDGVWIYYNEKGVITKKETYQNGSMVSVE